MAGRGRLLISAPKNVGTQETNKTDTSREIQTITAKINAIDLNNVNNRYLNSIYVLFNNMQPSDLKKALREFYTKSLNDSEFGKKFMFACTEFFEHTSIIAENSPRREILTNMQEEFELKDAICQADKPRFYNAITFLSNLYYLVDYKGVPINVLGMGLISYIELLLEGTEEELKLIAIQIGLNSDKLRKDVEKYKLLHTRLRSALIEKTSSKTSKYWLLLAVDLLSNDSNYFLDNLKDFYSENLGEPFTKVDNTIKTLKQMKVIKNTDLKNDSKNEEQQQQQQQTTFKITGLNVHKSKSDSEKHNVNYNNNNNSNSNNNNNKKNQFSQNNKNFSKNYNFDNSSRSKTNKNKSSHYHHDDRFDKDVNYGDVSSTSPNATPKSKT